MKNWKHWAFVAIIAIVGIITGFMACDNDNGTTTHTHEWEWVVTTPATATADGLETETCKTCGETRGTRPIEQTEPAKKDFPVSFNFLDGENPDRRWKATIQDARTDCGSQNLEEIKVKVGDENKSIITIIEEAIMGTFNANNNAVKNRFRNVFAVEGGVIMYVENTATTYKIKAPDNKTIYFHIDYLKSSPADIQQKVLDTITAMATGGDCFAF